MKMEKTKNASRNIVFGVSLKVYQILLPFIMRTVMMYTIGVEYLGLNSLFTSVLQVLNLAELGVGSAMVFSMYKPIAEDSVTSKVLFKNQKYCIVQARPSVHQSNYHPPLTTPHPEERIWAGRTPPAEAPGPGRSEDQA